MTDSALIDSICWRLIAASWGLAGAVFTLTKASSLIYLLAGRKGLQLTLLFSKNNRLQTARLGAQWGGSGRAAVFRQRVTALPARTVFFSLWKKNSEEKLIFLGFCPTATPAIFTKREEVIIPEKATQNSNIRVK